MSNAAGARVPQTLLRKGEPEKSLFEQWSKVAGWHGIADAYLARNTFCKTMWVAVVLVTMTMGLNQCISMIVDFFEDDRWTGSISLRTVSSLPVPTMVLCSLNTYNQSALAKHGLTATTVVENAGSNANVDPTVLQVFQSETSLEHKRRRTTDTPAFYGPRGYPDLSVFQNMFPNGQNGQLPPGVVQGQSGFAGLENSFGEQQLPGAAGQPGYPNAQSGWFQGRASMNGISGGGAQNERQGSGMSSVNTGVLSGVGAPVVNGMASGSRPGLVSGTAGGLANGVRDRIGDQMGSVMENRMPDGLGDAVSNTGGTVGNMGGFVGGTPTGIRSGVGSGRMGSATGNGMSNVGNAMSNAGGFAGNRAGMPSGTIGSMTGGMAENVGGSFAGRRLRQQARTSSTTGSHTGSTTSAPAPSAGKPSDTTATTSEPTFAMSLQERLDLIYTSLENSTCQCASTVIGCGAGAELTWGNDSENAVLTDKCCEGIRTDEDYCFTVNLTWPFRNMLNEQGKIKIANSENTIFLLLNPRLSDYMSDLIAGDRPGQGFRLHIGVGDDAKYNSKPLLISPGSYSLIELTLEELDTIFSRERGITSIVKPKPPCVHAANYSYLTIDKYQRWACEADCHIRREMEVCECTTMEGDFRPADIYCRNVSHRNICKKVMMLEKNDPESHYHRCKVECAESCQWYSISSDMSTTSFPAPAKVDSLRQYLNNNGNWFNFTQEDVKQLALIEVYYRAMTMRFIERSERVTINELISNIGGALGAWAGISLITIYQAIIYITIGCTKIIARRRRRRSHILP